MQKYKIAIGCDHTVTPFKDQIAKALKDQGHSVIDCGTYNLERTHYPIYGREVALKVAKKECNFGIVICGTGIGIANSANKVKNIRCILASDLMLAKLARENYDANILAMGGRVNGIGKMLDLVNIFLNTNYKNINHKEIEMIDTKIDKIIDNKDLFTKIINRWCDGYYTKNIKQSAIIMPKDLKV